MPKILAWKFIDLGSSRIIFQGYGLMIATFAIALFTTPPIVRSGSIVCETSQVFYKSKPALQTDCKEFHPADLRLATGINARSLSYAQSIKAVPKLAKFFGISYHNNDSSFNISQPGFADQKITVEGSILESIYKQMLEAQFVSEPIRTHQPETPFNSL